MAHCWSSFVISGRNQLYSPYDVWFVQVKATNCLLNIEYDFSSSVLHLVKRKYVLIDKMGGPNGKVLGSFFYDERTRRSLVLVSWTRAKYFLIRPDSTHSISVLSCDPCNFLFLFYFLGSHLVGPYGFFQNCSRHCVLPDQILGFISEVFQWKNALILVHVRVTKKNALRNH